MNDILNDPNNNLEFSNEIVQNYLNAHDKLSRKGQQLQTKLNGYLKKNIPIKSIKDIVNDPACKYMNKDEVRYLFHQYVLDFHNKNTNSVVEVIIKDDGNEFKSKIENLAITSSQLNRLLSKNDFLKYIRGWKGRGEKDDDEWYNLYITEMHKQPGWTVKVNKNQTQLSYTVYKSPNKRKKLVEDIIGKAKNQDKAIADISEIADKENKKEYVPNNFPLKENKKYYLHSVHEPGTYFMDIMFTGKLGYLLCINANTRYLYASVLNRQFNFGKGIKYGVRCLKNVSSFKKAFEKCLDDGMIPVKLIGDNEGAFKSCQNEGYFNKIIQNRFGIENGEFQGVRRMKRGVYPRFMPTEYSKSEPLHTSLGIIDRVIRTLRDMAYNGERGVITPEDMKDLVSIYNRAPHTTLSRFAGEEVTPEMVQNDPELEKFIMRRICQENYNVRKQDGYELEVGDEVKVYNDTDKFQKRRSIIQPGNHYVAYYENGLYNIVDDEGNDQFMPRAKIQPIVYKNYEGKYFEY